MDVHSPEAHQTLMTWIVLLQNHLLLLKDQPTLPLGVFTEHNNYVRRR